MTEYETDTEVDRRRIEGDTDTHGSDASGPEHRQHASLDAAPELFV